MIASTNGAIQGIFFVLPICFNPSKINASPPALKRAINFISLLNSRISSIPFFLIIFICSSILFLEDSLSILMTRDEAYQIALLHVKQAIKDNLTTLNLRGFDLTEIPQEIASLTQLQSFNLSDNQNIKRRQCVN